jgi:hypothetical protein
MYWPFSEFQLGVADDFFVYPPDQVVVVVRLTKALLDFRGRDAV